MISRDNKPIVNPDIIPAICDVLCIYDYYPLVPILCYTIPQHIVTLSVSKQADILTAISTVSVLTLKLRNN